MLPLIALNVLLASEYNWSEVAAMQYYFFLFIVFHSLTTFRCDFSNKLSRVQGMTRVKGSTSHLVRGKWKKMLFYYNLYFDRWVISWWQFWQAFNLIFTQLPASKWQVAKRVKSKEYRVNSSKEIHEILADDTVKVKSERKSKRKRKTIAVIKELYFCQAKKY